MDSFFRDCLPFLYACTGIPVRHYADFQADASCLPEWMHPDPFSLQSGQIHKFRKKAGILESALPGMIYGYLVPEQEGELFVLGPVFTAIPTEAETDRFLSSISIPETVRPAFRDGLFALPQITNLRLLSLLTAIREILSFRQPQRHTLTAEQLKELNQFLMSDRISSYYEFPSETTVISQTFVHEKTMIELVKKGDLQSLEEVAYLQDYNLNAFASDFPLISSRMLFMVISTLLSRAAIDGGIDPVHSISLHLSYIQRVERLQTAKEVFLLLQEVTHEYTHQVKLANRFSSPLVRRAARYIDEHISSRLSTQELADALFVSRGHLSNEFTKETGQKLSAYIQEMKLREACRLLRYSQKSIAEISEMLSFSSQSHFSTLFKKHYGMKPVDYRKQF